MVHIAKKTGLIRIIFLSLSLIFITGTDFKTYAGQNKKKTRKTVVHQKKRVLPKKETKKSIDAPIPIVDDTPINPKKYNKGDTRKPYYNPGRKDNRSKDSLYSPPKKKKKKSW